MSGDIQPKKRKNKSKAKAAPTAARGEKRRRHLPPCKKDKPDGSPKKAFDG